MSASAVKPALPTAGAQAPKVGSGAPPATTNNPPPAGGPKVLPATGSPNKSVALPSANHAAVGSVPLSLVQEHKTGGGGLTQQPPPRTPEKTKEHPVTLGVKPTSNGVEGSVNRPTATSQPSSESKKLDEGAAAAPVLNHSADVAQAAATPPQTQGLAAGQPTQNNPLVSGAQPSPPKPQPAAVLAGAANHSALVNVTNKLEGLGGEGKPSVPEESAEPAPVTVPFVSTSVTSTQHQQPQVAPPQLPGPSQHLAPPQQPQPPPPPPPPQQQQTQLPPPPQQQTQPAPPQQLQSALTPQPQQTSPQQQQQQQQQQLQPPAPLQQQVPLLPTQQEHYKPTSSLADTSKPRTEAPKPEFKVATPPRNSKRKREIKPPTEGAKAPAADHDDRKSKRVRTQTQPYQSPLPELTYIAKLKTLVKSPDDKLIVFYKNEFLAVRNAEGSFYICQAMQNIYKSSPRIRIRWLSQEKKDNKPTDVYIPDFYDATDFDCILTNLELKKLDKNRYQLPEEERERTQSILKRALDVEKGVSESAPVTEEHPDGLDLSLFRDESQLKKRKSLKRTSRRKENPSGAEDGYEGLTGDDESEEEVKKKKPKPNKRVEKPKVSAKEKVKTKEKPVEKRAERTSERGRDRGLASKRRSESVAAAAAVKNAAVKQTVAKHAAVRQAASKAPERKPKVVVKPTKKPEPVAESSIPTRSTKTRSAKVTPQPKSSPVTRTKEREHRGAIPAKGRKKSGKKA